jgi:hypothetical protein
MRTSQTNYYPLVIVDHTETPELIIFASSDKGGGPKFGTAYSVEHPQGRRIGIESPYLHEMISPDEAHRLIGQMLVKEIAALPLIIFNGAAAAPRYRPGDDVALFQQHFDRVKARLSAAIGAEVDRYNESLEDAESTN